MAILEPLSSSYGDDSYLWVGAVSVQSDWLNSAFSPVVYGDIALSINTQYNTILIRNKYKLRVSTCISIRPVPVCKIDSTPTCETNCTRQRDLTPICRVAEIAMVAEKPTQFVKNIMKMFIVHKVYRIYSIIIPTWKAYIWWKLHLIKPIQCIVIHCAPNLTHIEGYTERDMFYVYTMVPAYHG